MLFERALSAFLYAQEAKAILATWKQFLWILNY